MKKTFLIMMCCLMLSGCGNDEFWKNENPKNDVIGENVGEEGEKILSEAYETLEEAKIIDGFLAASMNYEKYNSYASENGLGDTLVYVEGKVLNQTEINASDSENSTLAIVIEQEDGNRWCASVTSDSKIGEIEDENVRIFGTYLGFSDFMNLPTVAVADSDGKAKIQIEKSQGIYETIWSFVDYVEKELDKEIEAEDKEMQEDEDAQEDREAYVATMGEANALKSAQDYLEITAFSYSGLIEQLEFEKYTHEEAVYAADNCGADWNEQVAKSAKNYLDITSFSRDGLIEQLEFEGFTHEQAAYGAEQNGY